MRSSGVGLYRLGTDKISYGVVVFYQIAAVPLRTRSTCSVGALQSRYDDQTYITGSLMSISCIPDWMKLCLWGKAGGRCQYAGCNHPLYRDDMTQCEFNSAYQVTTAFDREAVSACPTKRRY